MSLKVVFNTWSGAFFNPGGGEVQLVNTREYLNKAGWNVDLYDQWSPQRNIDIFHQFSIQFGVEYPMMEYRNMGKKIALSTILWVEYPKGSDAYYYIKKIFGLADVLFTNSDMESEKLSAAFDIDLGKFKKTINAVSGEYLDLNTQFDFREHFRIKGDFLLTVANLDRRKNTHMLLRACRELKKNLVSIGHVRDRDYYNEIMAEFPDFYHLGPVQNSAILKSAYQQAELFVLPSLCETPGIAALEAASQGAKLVITREGSASEYFGNLASYVDPVSFESVSKGIENELITARNRLELINLVQDKYTWTNAAEQVGEGYRQILDSF